MVTQTRESRRIRRRVNTSSPLLPSRDRVFTQGRRHTLGYRCPDTCCWPEYEAYPVHGPRNLVHTAERPGKILLSAFYRRKSEVIAETSAESNAEKTTRSNHASRLNPAKNTTTTTPTTLLFIYDAALDTSLNCWLTVYKNSPTTSTLPTVTTPLGTITTWTPPRSCNTSTHPTTPCTPPHPPSASDTASPTSRGYNTYPSNISNTISLQNLLHLTNTLLQPSTLLNFLFFRLSVMTDEQWAVPERLPINDIDYLSDLLKEVKEAYLINAIRRSKRDMDKLLKDHKEARDLIQLTLDQTLKQGKPNINQLSVDNNVQFAYYIPALPSPFPQNLNKSYLQAPLPVPAYTPAYTPSSDPRLIRVFHHGARNLPGNKIRPQPVS